MREENDATHTRALIVAAEVPVCPPGTDVRGRRGGRRCLRQQRQDALAFALGPCVGVCVCVNFGFNVGDALGQPYGHTDGDPRANGRGHRLSDGGRGPL
jgi:hypothetical protein